MPGFLLTGSSMLLKGPMAQVCPFVRTTKLLHEVCCNKTSMVNNGGDALSCESEIVSKFSCDFVNGIVLNIQS